MNPRIIGCPKDYTPDSYVALLPERFSHALLKSKLCKTPLIYRISRLEMCCNSWYGTDAELVAALWTDYILVFYNWVGLYSPESLILTDDLDELRQKHLDAFRRIGYFEEIDSPLAFQIKHFGPVIRKFYLRGLGCAVEDVQQEFYLKFQELYPYLYLETRELVADWRNVAIFERQLRKIPNFEL